MTDYLGADYLAFVLVAVGAINWGIAGLGVLLTGDVSALISWNLVHATVGQVSVALEGLIYLLVGVAGTMDALGITGGYGWFSDDRSMRG